MNVALRDKEASAEISQRNAQSQMEATERELRRYQENVVIAERNVASFRDQLEALTKGDVDARADAVKYRRMHEDVVANQYLDRSKIQTLEARVGHLDEERKMWLSDKEGLIAQVSKLESRGTVRLSTRIGFKPSPHVLRLALLPPKLILAFPVMRRRSRLLGLSN